ncbi:MAG: intradiol ring-cleavage dioxygenase, partial [Chloroflexi bacterium]|nr:intradiol ring-cleavage dioxygenase [Chloroflexota bacterium]
ASATAASATAPAAATAAPAAVAVAAPSCIVRPALTEGPFFVDEKLDRSDIRTDPSDNTVRPGARLTLTMNVARIQAAGCTAIPGATVDLWQCDALGVYSDVQDSGGSTRGKRFLRGFQTTNASGQVRFVTVYPGWYRGRATHLHFKVRVPSGGRTADFTSQLFFDDALTDTIYSTLAPYTQRGVAGRLRNSGDGIFRESGDQLTLAVTRSGDGYAATFDIGLSS